MSDLRDLRERLPEHALGALAPEEAAEVEAAVAKDPELAAEVDAWRETVGRLAHGTVAPEPAPPALWARIEADLGEGAARRPFAAFAARIGRALTVSAAAAKALLDRIDLASAWSVGPSETSRLYHIEPGPGLPAGAVAGFVKVAPGQRFPAHTHHGEELVIVLQGGFRDEDGTVVRAGEEARKPAGSKHWFDALEGETLIYLAVIEGAVEFDAPFEL
jgi:putative transcriptional regulator